MILIIGRFQVHAERLAEFQAFARTVAAEERRVEGCESFEILQDVEGDNRFAMIEQWRDQAALNHHLQSEAYAQNSPRMESFMVSEADWSEYEV